MKLAIKKIGRVTQHHLPLSKTAGVIPRRRWNSIESSSSAQTGQKAVSPHVGFYKTFTRPVAKVLLMATFTYQLAYWAWVKLEKDEEKREKNAEIEGLEKQLEGLKKKEKTP